MAHVFLPSDPRLKRLATQIEEERKHALIFDSVSPEDTERGERSEAKEPFRALWSSAQRDDEVLQTTQPGDALQLFAEPAPPISPALAAFTPVVQAAPPEPETSFERRERLRAERHNLVALIARRDKEPHSKVNSWVNREVGVRSVDKATDEQLERANKLLERELNRKR
jgi:hypothetical protein